MFTVLGISQRKMYKWLISTWKDMTIISHHGNANQNYNKIPLDQFELKR